MNRRGFTVVELLVVIAIISVVAALTLPAVQYARESSRRTSCANNIRQLGGAIQQHYTMQQFYPSAGWGTYWLGDTDRKPGIDQPGGWMYQVLPYMEREGLFNMPQDGDSNTITAAQQAAAAAASREPVPAFYCPSKRGTNTKLFPLVFGPKPAAGLQAYNAGDVPEVCRSDYKVNGGTDRSILVNWGNGPVPVAVTGGFTMPNPRLPNAGFPSMASANGVFFQKSQLTSTDLKDGAGVTYLVGEKYLNPQAYENGTDPADNQSILSGDALDQLAFSDVAPLRDQRGVAEPYRWGSSHDGVFQVMTCDGAIHAVSFDIDAEVHRRLGNRMDGLPVDEGKF